MEVPATALPGPSRDATAEPLRGGATGGSDAAALTEVAGPVRRFLRRIVGDEHVDDVASDTMLALLEQSGRRPVRRPVSYALRTAWNKAVDLLRREGREPRTADPDALDALPARPSQHLDELREWLDAGLARLSAADRALLHLRYDEGLDYRELAAALGVPTGTIGRRLHHARQQLARVLKEGDDGRGLSLVLMFLPALCPRVTSLAEALGFSTSAAAKIAVPSLAVRMGMYAWGVFIMKNILVVAAVVLGIGGVAWWMWAPANPAAGPAGALAAPTAPAAAATPPASTQPVAAVNPVITTPFEDRDSMIEVPPRLIGRVVSTEGAAVASARVSVAPRGPNGGVGITAGFDLAAPTADTATRRSVTTDADGTFTADVAGLGAMFDIVADAPGFAPGIVEQVGLSTIPLEIRLEHGLTVTGTVRDLDDHPIVGARVAFRALAGHARLTRPTTTDDKGAFTLTGLPHSNHLTLGAAMPGTSSPTGAAHLLVEADGFAPRRVACNVDPQPGQPPQPLDIHLSRGSALEGVITDATTHEPVPNATVAFWLLEGMTGTQTDRGVVYRNPFGSRIVATVKTAADGRYRFDHVPALVAGITLLAQSSMAMPSGRMGVGGIAASCDGYAPAGARVGTATKEGEVQTLDLALTHPATVIGRVVDERGHPMAGLRVFASLPQRPDANWSLVSGEAGVLGGAVLSDADGHFRHETVPTQPDGPATASLRACGCDLAVGNSASVKVTVSAGTTVTAPDLVVPRAETASVAGDLRDDAGRPVAGAFVEVAAPRLPSRGQPGLPGFITATSDARGAFTVAVPVASDPAAETRAASTVDLMITARGLAFALVPASPAGERLKITLHAGAALRGRVLRADGTPAAFALVRPKSGVPEEVARSAASVTGRQLTATADAAGNFTLDGLPATAMTLQAMLPRESLNSAVGGPFVAPADGVVLTMPRPEDRNAGLSLKLNVVDDATGAPFTGAFSATTSDGKTPFGDHADVGRGTATFAHIKPGIYTLQVAAPGFVAWTRPAFVVNEKSVAAPLEIRLGGGSKIEGSVTLPVGRTSCDGIEVIATPADALAAPGRVRVEPDGRFVLRGVGAGAWSLRAEDLRREPRLVTAQPLAITGGTDQTGIQLDLIAALRTHIDVVVPPAPAPSAVPGTAGSVFPAAAFRGLVHLRVADATGRIWSDTEVLGFDAIGHLGRDLWTPPADLVLTFTRGAKTLATSRTPAGTDIRIEIPVERR